MLRKHYPIGLLVLISLALPVLGQGTLSEHPQVEEALTKLDLWIEQQMAHGHIPGLSIAIVYDQKVVWARGYGFADEETKVPAAPSTVYRIGSVTKLFTATAILQLRDQGRLRLDDPVSDHLPWFSIRSSFPNAPDVTIRQLLTHSSGLPREAAFPYWTTHVFPTREELQGAVPGQDAIHAPETTYHYSNLGMSLLGEIVTELSGQPWAEYVEEKILRPLGMESSSASPDKELLSRRTTPYMRRMPDGTRKIFDYYDAGAISPAANMVSTVEDLSRFAALQFRDDPTEDGPVLKGSTLREMHRVHWLYDSFSGGRGLGFSIFRSDDTTFVTHGGWIGGNRTHFLTVPSRKIAVIAAVNADDVSPYRFSRQAYDTIAPALQKTTAPKAAKKADPDPAWQNYVGLYTDPWGWEYQVMILGGDLVIYGYDYPPNDDATSGFTRLTPVDGNVFRRPDNELVTFELDEEGRVKRIKRRYDYIFPVESSK